MCAANLLLIAFGPLTVRAQSQRDSIRADSAGAEIGAVTVSASRSAGVTGGAAAVVVRADQLRSSAAPMLDQALRESPFVLVRQNSRGEMEISVRGSDSRQAAVLMNGVPLTLGWDHRTDPSLIPITGIEHNVIVRGLASLLHGPNTLGGSIEISHSALDEPTGGQLWAGAGVDQYGAAVGSLGVGRRVADVVGGVLSMRVGGAYRQRDGVALPGGVHDPTQRDGLRTGTDLRQADGFMSLRWNGNAGKSFGVMLSGSDAARGVPPEEHISDPRLWRYPVARRGIAMVSANSGLISSPFGSASLELGVGINAGRLRIESFDNRSYDTVVGEELGDERAITSRALLTHSLGVGTLRASVTSADIRYEEILSPAAPADYHQQLFSAGVEVEAPLTTRTRIAGGLVFDQSHTPLTGGRRPRQASFNNPGWRLGLSHRLNERAQLHTSISQRSRFPSLRELYSGALDRFVPNPELRPETLRGIETGVTLNRFAPAALQSSLQLVGFRHELNDALIRISLADSARFQRVNRDRVESLGVELLGGFSIGDSPDRAVSVNGDATLQRIRIVDPGAANPRRRAENNPERRGRIEVAVPVTGQLRTFTTARYTGTQYCLNGDTGNEDQLPARTVADIAVERTFLVASRGPFRHVRALLAFDNVGNTAVYDQCGLPQPGRTLRLMMTLR